MQLSPQSARRGPPLQLWLRGRAAEAAAVPSARTHQSVGGCCNDDRRSTTFFLPRLPRLSPIFLRPTLTRDRIAEPVGRDLGGRHLWKVVVGCFLFEGKRKACLLCPAN